MIDIWDFVRHSMLLWGLLAAQMGKSSFKLYTFIQGLMYTIGVFMYLLNSIPWWEILTVLLYLFLSLSLNRTSTSMFRGHISRHSLLVPPPSIIPFHFSAIYSYHRLCIHIWRLGTGSLQWKEHGALWVTPTTSIGSFPVLSIYLKISFNSSLQLSTVP